MARLKEESGYSLVEVMASIMILTIAIIPMVAMFDMGLSSATRSSNYDKARSLANKQLERAKNLPYDSTNTQTDIKDNFPYCAPDDPLCNVNEGTTLYDANGRAEVDDQEDSDSEYDDFRYDVVKQYVRMQDAGGGAMNFVNVDGDTAAERKMVRITVTVRWGGDDFDDNDYTTSAIVAE